MNISLHPKKRPNSPPYYENISDFQWSENQWECSGNCFSKTPWDRLSMMTSTWENSFRRPRVMILNHDEVKAPESSTAQPRRSWVLRRGIEQVLGNYPRKLNQFLRYRIHREPILTLSYPQQRPQVRSMIRSLIQSQVSASEQPGKITQFTEKLLHLQVQPRSPERSNASI